MLSIRHKEGLPEVLSKDEIKKLIRSARNFKHQYMLAYFYSTGMRLNEVRMLKTNEIFVERKQFLVRNGKGRKDRYVVFTVPEELNGYFIRFPKELYNLLFQASRETLLQFFVLS
jgi:integrase/recombinase XerD